LDGIMQEPENLLAAPKYRAWKRTVESNGCVFREVELLADCRKRDGSLLFAFLKTRIEDPSGRALPAYALLRGHAVVIVTEVANRESGEKKFLMLRQRRVGSGAETLEFPAGMVDERVDDPAGVAIQELREETGLEVRRDQLIRLNDKPLYTSSGLDDEAIHFFGCSLDLPAAEYQALAGGTRGKAEEGEFIRLELWDHDAALPHVDSVQVRLGFCLWRGRTRPLSG
jgi:8-oxo-dGTP pyrophosphatase MutT (NUDIX family)